ncbi:MAG: MFS transporter [Candidatus Poribacteria bacterium]|nr:MFS transporter [Candidatus Poribacteria bacterium]
MKIASTETLQQPFQPNKEKEREQSRNFWFALLQGTFIRISFAFTDSSTVLSAFVYQLTKSNVFVGLTGSMMSAGWMWPQLLIANLLEHRPRKMPFYIFGMSLRTLAWFAIFLGTLLIGARNDRLLAVGFVCLYFIGASSMGISTIPYMDIISKSIEPQRRARFFSLRNFTGGIFAIFIGFLVRHVLSDNSGLVFPNNYALLFGCNVVAVGIGFVSFLKIREPIHAVQTKRQSLWQHLKQGPGFIQKDRNYRLFLLFRIGSHTAGMCVPFYVPYALERLNIPDETIGLFLAVAAISGVISSVAWGYVGEKYGVRWILIGTSGMACVAPLVAGSVQHLPIFWQIPCYFLIFALHGAAMNGMMVGFMTYMINIAPPRVRPTYLGFMNTLLFPIGFMPVVAGNLVGLIGYEGVFAISLGMGLFAFLISTRLEDVYYEEEETVQ